ncbi:hypothetical protein [uncultured Ruegeria sp.]|uniref:hypothetical protein n=1 Tax=uncultured Ruegeria sp. TaxID=259304 RepID=UPI00262DA567|nr:hypothetical protein [uncultured Ruegeria sp.]
MSTSVSAAGGVLKTGNQSSIDYSAVSGSLFGTLSHAGAGYLDSITVTNGPSSGFLDISLRVQGTGTIAYTGPSSNSGSLRLEVFMNGAPGSGAVGLNIVNDYFSNMSIDQIFTASIPYQNSVADISVYLNTFVSCPGAAAGTGGTCSSSMNFLNSATVVGTQVFDSGMNLVTGATLTSASGFNYATGITPPMAPVPIPASIPLLASAIALLGFLSFGRRKQSERSVPAPTPACAI